MNWYEIAVNDAKKIKQNINFIFDLSFSNYEWCYIDYLEFLPKSSKIKTGEFYNRDVFFDHFSDLNLDLVEWGDFYFRNKKDDKDFIHEAELNKKIERQSLTVRICEGFIFLYTQDIELIELIKSEMDARVISINEKPNISDFKLMY